MTALARFSSVPALSGPPGFRSPLQGWRLRRPLRAVLAVVGAAGLAAGALDVASRLVGQEPPAGQALANAAAAAAWVEIRHPLGLYDLAGTEFSKRPAGYRAWRREADGAREDVMSFGRPGEDRPFLQLSLLRAGSPAQPSDDELADGLGRLAGTRGFSATAIRPAAPVDTRLGPFETADLLLWDRGSGTPCLGFRGEAHGGSVLHVSGFACGTAERPLDRAALACALDRVDLVSAGDDAALRAVFVAAERRGGASCAGAGAIAPASLLGTRRRSGWLDPESDMPPLRGLFEATARQR